MPESIEYKGYVISGTAELFVEGVWAGNYTISLANSGAPIREARKVTFRGTHELACRSAVAYGLVYVDGALPPAGLNAHMKSSI